MLGAIVLHRQGRREACSAKGVVLAADLCGWPEATVPGEVVALGAASALALLLGAAVPAPAAGEEEDTEESGDRDPGCRSRAVRIRHGAGDGAGCCCCFLEPRQSPSSSSSSSCPTTTSSSSSSAPEFSSTSSAAAGGGSPEMNAAVGPAPPPLISAQRCWWWFPGPGSATVLFCAWACVLGETPRERGKELLLLSELREEFWVCVQASVGSFRLLRC